MKSIVFFNNKGGVGKTTLACNVVSYLSKYHNKRVLLIDADPQCNATQAMLHDEVCDDIYLAGKSSQKSVYDLLTPLENGYPDISEPIPVMLGSQNNYGADLIPGHPALSMLEDRLSRAWSDLLAGDIAGFKITNWARQLLNSYSDRYDIIVFDVGPSLGALNRTVILSSDYFLAPFGCDIFSMLGISNISTWISRWTEDYRQSLQIAERRQRRSALEKANVILDPDRKYRFVGYSVQQYVSRKFKDGPRPVRAYENIMAEIPGVVHEKLGFLTPSSLDQAALRLGDIPYVYSLVPLSQASKTPIHNLSSSDGVAGSQYRQVNEYKELMENLTARLLRNIQ